MSEIPDDMPEEEIKQILEDLRSQVPSVKRRLRRRMKLKEATISLLALGVKSEDNENDASIK